MSAKNLSLLHIDDDVEDQELFLNIVKDIDSNILCFTANSGEEALKFLSGSALLLPDFIFLDINMPVLDGKSTLARIREFPFAREIPVIIHSTSLQKEEIEIYTRLGAAFCFQKPVHYREWVDILRRIFFAPPSAQMKSKG